MQIFSAIGRQIIVLVWFSTGAVTVTLEPPTSRPTNFLAFNPQLSRGAMIL
jgi:hypothetical protein